MRENQSEFHEYDLRIDTAIQLIAELYNIQIMPVNGPGEKANICKRYRYHPIQYFFDENVFNMLCSDIEEMFVYHVSDVFQINFILFMLCGKLYMLGPFCVSIMTDRETANLLKQYSLENLGINQFLVYRSTFPCISESTVYGIVSAFIHAVNPLESEKTLKRVNHEEKIDDVGESVEYQKAHHHILVERRYAREQQFIDNIVKGNARNAIHHLHYLQQGFSYMKKISPSLENDRIGVAIARTLIRIAAMRAGLSPVVIDKISSVNMRETIQARTLEEIYISEEKMIRDFCKAIREVREKKYSAIVQSTLYCLDHDYGKDIQLSELASELSVTETYLISRFKKEVGDTPITYLTRVRMHNATLLLANSSMTISDISTAVGIGDSNYFARLFKREYGKTPSAYRKQHFT